MPLMTGAKSSWTLLVLIIPSFPSIVPTGENAPKTLDWKKTNIDECGHMSHLSWLKQSSSYGFLWMPSFGWVEVQLVRSHFQVSPTVIQPERVWKFEAWANPRSNDRSSEEGQGSEGRENVGGGRGRNEFNGLNRHIFHQHKRKGPT